MVYLDRGGLLYMVHFTPVSETGPHLNEQQFHETLSHTRYQIWCSHHPYFYIESIRIRMSLLAGAVPIKVQFLPFPESTPFSYLIFDRDTFATGLRNLDFERTRQRLYDDYCAMPLLETAFVSFFDKYSS